MVRLFIVSVILQLIFASCVKSKPSIPDLVGKWKTVKCNLGFMHGNFLYPLGDSVVVPKGSFSYCMDIQFNNDSTYLLNNESFSKEEGRYKVSQDTIELNAYGLSPVKFKIDSLVSNQLFIKLDRNCFFSVKNDTVRLLIGEQVKLVLKRM